MPSRIRAHLTYANVMATIALFIALGGSSYAALTVTGRNVPRNALTGADIKNLTGKDVRNNSLTGADAKNLRSRDVADGSLLAQDFASGQLPRGEKGPEGDRGERGLQGEQGETGAAGMVRAHAVIEACAPVVGNPWEDCTLTRNKDVAYALRVATGTYCVGVNNATPVQDMAIVTSVGSPPNMDAQWRSGAQSACVASEYEIYTWRNGALSNDPWISISIP